MLRQSPTHLIDPNLLALNVGFLLDREIAPLRVTDDRLLLGMRDPGDCDAIAAMRFATRLEIDPRAMDEVEWFEWREALTPLLQGSFKTRCRSLGASGTLVARRLLNRLAGVLGSRTLLDPLLVDLGRLTNAGLSFGDAADILLSAAAARPALVREELTVIERLSVDHAFNQVVANYPGGLRWLDRLAPSNDRLMSDPHRIGSIILAIDSVEQRQRAVLRLIVWTAAAGFALVAIGGMHAWPVIASLSMIGLTILTRLRSALSGGLGSDLERAEALRVVAASHRPGALETDALRVGLVRSGMAASSCVYPTRAILARHLHLTTVDEALFLCGALPDAADRLANAILDRVDMTIDRARLLACCIGSTSVALCLDRLLP